MNQKCKVLRLFISISIARYMTFLFPYAGQYHSVLHVQCLCLQYSIQNVWYTVLHDFLRKVKFTVLTVLKEYAKTKFILVNVHNLTCLITVISRRNELRCWHKYHINPLSVTPIGKFKYLQQFFINYKAQNISKSQNIDKCKRE